MVSKSNHENIYLKRKKKTRHDKIQDEKNNSNNCTWKLTNVNYKLEGIIQTFEHTNKEKQNEWNNDKMINKTNIRSNNRLQW